MGQNFKGELADRRIQVPGDGLDDLHIVTRPGFELSGTLLMNGQPLRNLTRAVIAVSPAEFTLHPASGASVFVEADGTFRMPNLSGNSLVRALNLPQGLMVQRISAGTADIGDFGVEMVQNLNVDVIIGRQTELRGTITTRRGTAIPGMSVVLFAQDLADGRFPTPPTFAPRQPPPTEAFASADCRRDATTRRRS